MYSYKWLSELHHWKDSGICLIWEKAHTSTYKLTALVCAPLFKACSMQIYRLLAVRASHWLTAAWLALFFCTQLNSKQEAWLLAAEGEGEARNWNALLHGRPFYTQGNIQKIAFQLFLYTQQPPAFQLQSHTGRKWLSAQICILKSIRFGAGLVTQRQRTWTACIRPCTPSHTKVSKWMRMKERAPVMPHSLWSSVNVRLSADDHPLSRAIIVPLLQQSKIPCD